MATAQPALSPAQADAYLARIGMPRPTTANLATLTQLHRAHLMAFTWEALDAFMAWPNTPTPQAAFAKMVEQRRGGWCYEMNGLFGAALAALGFRVTRLCGGVDREKLGDLAIGNHLTLRVDLDQPYLAEVGVADAIVEPVPIATGPIHQRGFAFSLSALPNGWLRFHNHPRGIARSFDFHPTHADEATMAATHAWLMQDPGSPFTNALAILRHTPHGYVALQNTRLRHVTATEDTEHTISSPDELAETLATTFNLAIPQPRRIWDRLQTIGTLQAA